MTESLVDAVLAPPPARRRWPRLLASLLIFLCGGVVGAVGGSIWMRERMVYMLQHPETVSERALSRIRSVLALTDEQAAKVEEIVRRRHARMESFRAAAYPKQMAEFSAMRAEVDAVLTSEQGPKWSALCDSIAQRYLPARPVGPPPDDLIYDRFDANNDGALSEEETPPGMWRRLRLADMDGDGGVTREEYSNAQNRKAPE